jgi:hypothetical protein
MIGLSMDIEVKLPPTSRNTSPPSSAACARLRNRICSKLTTNHGLVICGVGRGRRTPTRFHVSRGAGRGFQPSRPATSFECHVGDYDYGKSHAVLFGTYERSRQTKSGSRSTLPRCQIKTPPRKGLTTEAGFCARYAAAGRFSPRADKQLVKQARNRDHHFSDPCGQTKKPPAYPPEA